MCLGAKICQVKINDSYHRKIGSSSKAKYTIRGERNSIRNHIRDYNVLMLEQIKGKVGFISFICLFIYLFLCINSVWNNTNGKKILKVNYFFIICCQEESLKSRYRLNPYVGETKPERCPRPSSSTAVQQQERVSQNSGWRRMAASICLFGTPPPFVHFCEYLKA